MIAATAERRLGGVDLALLIIFFIGIYLGVSIPVAQGVPFPSAPSGLAGIVLLWRRRDRIVPLHLSVLLMVIVIYIAAILSATDYGFLGKRFTGLIQLVYSLVIGYAMFLTILEASRKQLAGLFFWFLVFIVVGCFLEQYTPLKAVSDAVRVTIYDHGVYESDLRDQMLYGKVRPKLFTSEPSAVTFGYTLFLSAWFIITATRWRLLIFAAFLGIGLVAMPGPTLLLALLVLPPYYFFITPLVTPRHRLIPGYRTAILIVGAILLIVFVLLGTTLFAERFNQIASGEDPSFFYRVIGPVLVAMEVLRVYPWAGAGLTGEPFINELVINTFVKSAHYSAAWKFSKVSEVITNYFWLHWIYLGLVWGIVVLAAHTAWLRVLSVPSVLFCWAFWVIFGQASGAYVGPKTWVVLLLAAGLSIVCTRVSGPTMVPVPQARHQIRQLRVGNRLRNPGLAHHP
jgi:hypothetical protein